MKQNFTNPRARFFDGNGDPLAGGRVRFVEAGTNTPKEIYTTAEGDIPNTNPNILDADGYVTPSTGVHLGVGLYDVYVEELIAPNTWSPLWNYPDVQGELSAENGSIDVVGYVGTIDDLRALDAGSYTSVIVGGYYTNGDLGGRTMIWDAADTSADNGGTIIAPNGAPATGRWIWSPEQDTTAVTPQLFGAFPSDGSLDVTTQLQSMISWMSGNGWARFRHLTKIKFDITGTYYISSTITFAGPYTLEIEPYVEFTTNSGSHFVNIFCLDAHIKANQPIVVYTGGADSVNLNFQTSVVNKQVEANWWGTPSIGFDASAQVSAAATYAGDNNILHFSDFRRVSSGAVLFKSRVSFTDNGGLLMDGAEVYVYNDILFNKINDKRGCFASGTPANQAKVFFRDRMNYAHSRWFSGNYDGVPSITDYGWYDENGVMETNFINDFIDNNTQSGAREFTWYVDELDSPDIEPTDIARFNRGNYWHLKFIWEFTKPCNMDWTKGTMEAIVHAPDIQIFKIVDYAPTFRPAIAIFNDINPIWFGATLDSDDVNAPNLTAYAIEAALRVCEGSLAGGNWYRGNRSSVDGQGYEYTLGRGIQLYDTNSGNQYTSATLKNATLVFLTLSAHTDCINTYTGIVIDNCRINHDDSYPIIFANGNQAQIEIRNSLIDTEGPLISGGADDLTITNSKLIQDDTGVSDTIFIDGAIDQDYLNEGTIRISGCTLERPYSATTGFANLNVGSQNIFITDNVMDNIVISTLSNNTGSAVVTGNTIKRAPVSLTNPSNTTFKYNTLITDDYADSTIFIKSTLGAIVLEGLDITENTWQDNVSNPFTRATFQGITLNNTFASSGHDVEIHSNSSNGAYIQMGATRLQGSFDFATQGDDEVSVKDLSSANTDIPSFHLIPLFKSVGYDFTNMSFGFSNLKTIAGTSVQGSMSVDVDHGSLVTTVRITASFAGSGGTDIWSGRAYFKADLSTLQDMSIWT